MQFNHPQSVYGCELWCESDVGSGPYVIVKISDVLRRKIYSTRSQAVARIAGRTASQQTI